MESDRSIILQKKAILGLSLCIMLIGGLILKQEMEKKEVTEYVILEQQIELLNVVEKQEEEEKEVVKEPFEEIAELKEVTVQYLATKTAENKVSQNLEKAEKQDIIEVKPAETTSSHSKTTNLEQEIILPVEDTFLEIRPIALEESADEVSQTELTEDAVNQAEEPKTEDSSSVQAVEETKYPFEYGKVYEMTATAYCLCQKCCGKTPDHPYYGYTASGLKIIPGTGMKVIAVDPTVIPLNTHVYVEGLNGAWDYGYAIAADTGGAIKNQKIDLYMDSHSEALKWGRRTVNVYLLNEE